MNRTTAALGAAALAAAALLVPTTATAHAADCDPDAVLVDGLGFSQDVAVGTTKTKTLTLEVYTDASCTVTGAKATVHAPRRTTVVELTQVGTANGMVHWRGSLAIKPSALRNSDAGTWPTTYRVSGEHPDQLTVDHHVRRASRVSFNAGSEPVTGTTITYTGKLERASWDSDRYRGWSHRVDLYEEFSDSEDSDLLATPTSGSDGRYRVTQRYRGPGEYSANVLGTSTTARSHSRTDRVTTPLPR